MSIAKLFARITLAAVAVFAWADGSAFAADTPTPMPPPAPGVVGAAPVTVGEAGCASCQNGGAVVGGASCNKCGKWFTGHKDHKAPYPVNLCPGACFGYFQTQWRKWDEVCPYPYLGIGPGNNSKPPAGPYFPPNTGGVQPQPPTGPLPPPRPLDPKLMPDPKKLGSNDLPAIPVPPSKFGQ